MVRRNNTLKINTLLSLSLLSIPGFAASISTGVAPWQVNSNPAVIENPIAAPFWINNFGDGSWVGTTAGDGALTSSALAGTYTYTLNIGAFIGAAGTLSLSYAADNNVTWTLSNGTLAGTDVCNTNDCFSSPAGAPRSLTGTFAANSVLTATVVNTAVGPTGLLAVGTADVTGGFGAAPVPEPATLALLGLALTVLGLRRR